jgi:hypothetical protein
VGDGEQKVTLNIVINGETFPVDTNVNAPLTTVAERALTESGNSGRPLGEWELRDSNGALVDMNRKVKDVGLKNGARLFLSLRVGAGG